MTAAPGPQHRVLLAEDDEISQEIVSLLLLSTGTIDLQIVADGRSALEAVQTVDYDLLILDQNLPQITGDRIVRHLRAGNGRNSTTPILRLSAEIRAPGERRSGLGLETLLPKPLAGDVFLRTVQGLLQGEIWAEPPCQEATHAAGRIGEQGLQVS